MVAGPRALSVSYKTYLIHLQFKLTYFCACAAVFTTEDPCPTDNCSKYDFKISLTFLQKASWIQQSIALQ